MASDYVKGEMDVAEQSATFSFFINAIVHSSAAIIVTLLFATLAYAVGMSWLTALGIAFAVGIVMGVGLKMSGAWYAFLIILAFLTAVSGFVGGGLMGMMG